LLFGFAAFFAGAGFFLPAAFFATFFFAVAMLGYPPEQTANAIAIITSSRRNMPVNGSSALLGQAAHRAGVGRRSEQSVSPQG
jgi:hypothetical protein